MPRDIIEDLQGAVSFNYVTMQIEVDTYLDGARFSLHTYNKPILDEFHPPNSAYLKAAKDEVRSLWPV